MIQSVERAARILAVLGSGIPRLGVTEIADRLGLAKPTVHGLLRTLEKHDLVAQDPDTGKYSLGPGVVSLGNAFLDGSEVRARSLLWAESLAQRAGAAVWVAEMCMWQRAAHVRLSPRLGLWRSATPGLEAGRIEGSVGRCDV